MDFDHEDVRHVGLLGFLSPLPDAFSSYSYGYIELVKEKKAMEGLNFVGAFFLMFDVIWVALSYITNQATEVVPAKEEQVRGFHPFDCTSELRLTVPTPSSGPLLSALSPSRRGGLALRRCDPLSTFVIPPPLSSFHTGNRGIG